jgi:hypothetical protein
MGCYAVAVFAYKRLWNTVVLPVILQQAVVGGVTVLQPLLRGILLPPVILQEAVVGGVIAFQPLLRRILLLRVILH